MSEAKTWSENTLRDGIKWMYS